MIARIVEELEAYLAVEGAAPIFGEGDRGGGVLKVFPERKRGNEVHGDGGGDQGEHSIAGRGVGAETREAWGGWIWVGTLVGGHDGGVGGPSRRVARKEKGAATGNRQQKCHQEGGGIKGKRKGEDECNFIQNIIYNLIIWITTFLKAIWIITFPKII